MEIKIKHRRLGEKIMLIDEEDYEKIKDLNIILNITSNKNTYYAKHIVYKKGELKESWKPNESKHYYHYVKTINIHRLIMGLGDYKNDKRIINHKNGNGLDNRKENLEICDICYNSQVKRRVNDKRKFKNIHYDKSCKRLKRWRVNIKINKVRYQKRFLTYEEAKEYLENLKSKYL